MTSLLLNRLIHGYEDLEPVILGLMAMDKSFILIGRHGTGKTKLAKWLSHGFGDDSFVFYDATKDDLISIAGIPDPESIKTGKLRFVGHERSIWNKSVIVVDEITRAAKENQNLWLEILEERTCFGIPLKYRSIIATANPESYAAAFQLDEALLDRFYAVVPVPEMQAAIDSDDIKSMVKLSMSDGGNVSHEEIVGIFGEIRNAYSSLVNEKAMDKVELYLGAIIPPILAMIQEQNNLYMSPRTYCHILPEAIMSIAAYFVVAGSAEPLQDAALQAIRYSVATKLQTNSLAIEQYHRSASVLLKGGRIAGPESIKLEINSLNDNEKLLSYISENWNSMIAAFSEDEFEKNLKKIYNEITRNKNLKGLLKFQSILMNAGYNGDTLRQIKGQLGTMLFRARRKLLPMIQRQLAANTSGNVLTDANRKAIEQVENILKDNHNVFARTTEMLEIEALVLNISEKFEKPDIELLLDELKSLGKNMPA